MASQARKDRFLAALIAAGGTAGNGRLRESLQWAESTYDAVKDDLIAAGVVARGRGRGGAVSLAAPVKVPAKAAAALSVAATRSRDNGNGGNLGFEAQLFKAADK